MNNFNIYTALKGIGMGMAEVVPGVSGGTIAFITGIYLRLISSIKSFNPSLLGTYRSGGIKEVWKTIDGWFLVSLFGGMLVGIVTGVFLITMLLDNYPEPLWGFFFGLILSSSIYIAIQIENWNWKTILSLLIGAIVAFYICQSVPTEGSTSAFYIFISGVLAISALMLPGLSGSFILLLMGMYTVIIPNLRALLSDFNTESLRIVAIFSSGALVGVVSFTRVITWLFSHYKNLTFGLLTGFMLGSLVKVWPWRNPSMIMNKETMDFIEIGSKESWLSVTNEIKILAENNVFPSDYWFGDTPKVILTLICFIVGLLVVLLLERSQNRQKI